MKGEIGFYLWLISLVMLAIAFMYFMTLPRNDSSSFIIKTFDVDTATITIDGGYGAGWFDTGKIYISLKDCVTKDNYVNQYECSDVFIKTNVDNIDTKTCGGLQVFSNCTDIFGGSK